MEISLGLLSSSICYNFWDGVEYDFEILLLGIATAYGVYDAE